MSNEAVVIRLGWYPPVRSAIMGGFFGWLAAFGAFYASTPGESPDWGVVWFAGGIAAIFALMLLRSLFVLATGQRIATLAPEGLRARTCDNALIPWDLVISVTRVDAEFNMLSRSLAVILFERALRHDAYEVLLDRKVLELGVKHSENLGSIGFKLTPLKLSISSLDLARAFARFLPPEKCIGFDESVAQRDGFEIVRDYADAASAVVKEVSE